MANFLKMIKNFSKKTEDISIDDQAESQVSINFDLRSDDSLPNKYDQRSIRQDLINKKKLDLKSFEKIILFKTSFVKQFNSSDLVSKHKSLDKAPVFYGPSQLIQEAELNVMKFLRELMSEEINLLDDDICWMLIDDNKKSLICNQIISSLNERFERHPVAIENKKGRIIVYSNEAEILEEVKNYLKANLYQSFVSAKDAQIFKFIRSNLKTEIDELTETNDFINIFPKNTALGCGFVVMAYGHKKEFDRVKNKLKNIIEHIDREEVKLNIPSISVGAEIIIGGIEKKWNVMIDVLDMENGEVATLNVAIDKEVTLTLVEGKVEDQKVDVLVSSGCALGNGLVQKAVFVKAGPELQESFSTPVWSVGQVMETKAYNLPCKSVLHCLAKEWHEEESKESQEVLMKVVTICLQMANNKGLTSIAFPPIACGLLNMPPKISAECIFGSIENYAWSNQHSLKYIIIAIYDPQNLTFEAYKGVLDSRLTGTGSAWKIKKKAFMISIIGSCRNDVLSALRSFQDFFHDVIKFPKGDIHK